MVSKDENIAWLKSTFHPVPKPALPDDCIEYSLYIIDPSLDSTNASELRLKLIDVRKYANELTKQWLPDYIWQRQAFNLELLKDNGLNYLSGRTEYGDSIEDEWVIVWLLRELTKKFPTLWVKVSDSDGEFLLIEASGTLPAWLEPEVAENRVWINNGQLKIIKPSGNARSLKRTEEKLSLEDARTIVLSEQKRVMLSASIQEEAFYRLRNYPQQIKNNMHHALVLLPRKLVYLLLQKAAYVAPAIEAFYLRDPISLKPLRKNDAAEKAIFAPRDLVEVSVKFPRVAYAQIRSQDFPIPEMWKSKMPSPQDENFTAAETGMKLACGFEMLLSDSHYQDLPAVREMKLLLEDLDSGDAELPSDSELAQLSKAADDESWLNINFEDLQSELNRSSKNPDGKKAEFGDKAAQENLQRIVKQFETFLNDNTTEDTSGLFHEGDSDTDDLDDLDSEGLEEDQEGSFDDDEFTKLMQEMMGMPPEAMRELMGGQIDALENGALPTGPLVPGEKTKGDARVEELSSDEEESDDEEIRDIMRRMGAELHASGALDLNNGTDGHATTTKAILEHDETQNTEDPGKICKGAEEDFDKAFARNLLESFRSQGGRSGPASNLMAMMAESPTRDEYKGKGKGKGKAAVE